MDELRSMVGRSAILCQPDTKSAYPKALDKLAAAANTLSQTSEPGLLRNADEFVRTLPTLQDVQTSLLNGARYRFNRDQEFNKKIAKSHVYTDEYLVDDGRCGSPSAVGDQYENPTVTWAITEIPLDLMRARELSVGFPAGSGGLAVDLCLMDSFPYPKAGEPGFVDMAPAKRRLTELRADACESLYGTDRGCVLRVNVPARRDGFSDLHREGRPPIDGR